MSVLWTERDLQIAEALTRRLRILSVDQVARIWWPGAGGQRVARRRLRKLAEAGLIERRVVNVGVIPQQTTPLVCWVPGDAEPNVREVANQAKARWGRGAVPQEVVSATRLAANLFGSSVAGLPPVHHRDHDLLLGEVYVIYHTTKPAEAACWCGHDGRSVARELPRTDVLLIDAKLNVIRAVESAGRIGPREIVAFHERCFHAALPYELW